MFALQPAVVDVFGGAASVGAPLSLVVANSTALDQVAYNGTNIGANGSGWSAVVKLKGLTEKHLLKHSMRGEIPEVIRTRTKQPYRAPDSASFFEAGQPVDYAAELMGHKSIESAGLFDPVAVGKLFEKCRKGRAIGFGDNMAFVGVLSTMLLHEQFVRPATFTATGSRLAP